MKIICIGRNYSEHAEELKNEVPSSPVIFMKPDTALLRKGEPFFYPEFSENIQFEAELVFKINKIGKHIKSKFAGKYFTEFTLGIDFTARDVQEELKTKGLPWEISKAFDQSAAIGNFLQTKDYDLNKIEFSLKKNGEIVQQGNAFKMLFSIEKIIEYTSKFFTLKIGDIIFTGTPKGVGKVEINDHFEGYIFDKKVLDVKIK
ncbi:MAG: fumarylacetoacetate hydrolase family protein [Bacteroidetes bacterium]|nr:fumarylacetoacetate hydrolase family protein [Bacteroidota bacterium]